MRVKPGLELAEYIRVRNVSPRRLASRAGIDLPYLEAVLKGERKITEQLDAAINEYFLKQKGYWSSKQAAYDKFTAPISVEKEDANLIRV